ncbi:MAG: SEL1-like repeat protein [Pseudomonadota bacterium]
MARFSTLWGPGFALMAAAGFSGFQPSTAQSYRTAEVPALQTACSQSSGAACFYLGLRYSNGEGVEKDLKRATALFELSCEEGIGTGCYNAALTHFKDQSTLGGTPKDYAKSTPYYVKGCALDHMGSCDSAGNAYRFGWGVEADAERAVGYYHTACNAGDGDACEGAGDIYDSSQYGMEDEWIAISYYERGCELGDGDSCGDASRVYKFGVGQAAPNAGMAYRYAFKACELEKSYGCDWAGEHLRDGVGTVQDHRDARIMFESVCDKASRGDACYNAGLLYESGKGGARDIIKARALFERACAARWPTAEACEKL